MASLEKLAIRGIRSFDDKQISVIEFFSPVTVIVGHNGSGKTTIIECLKYATTGDQPPNTRGGAFIHDPKMANEKEVKAQVKLRFSAANGSRMLATRNLSVTVKKTGMTMKTLESVLAVLDQSGGKRGVISTKCAEMDAEIPHLLGVSKPVLENVIFCHQEDSYWPLAEPSALKKKFDDIFEATRYTKALEAIKSLRKDRVSELKADKERLESLSREKAHADKLKNRIADLRSTIANKELEYEEAKKQYEALVVANQLFYDRATKFRDIYMKLETLQEQKTRYVSELEEARGVVQELEDTDEELSTRLANFDEHIAKQKQKQRAEEGRRKDLEDNLVNARQQHVALVNEHGMLVSEANAQEQRISDREHLIRELGNKHNIKGYDQSPLSREKVLEFISRLTEVQRRQMREFENLQNDGRERTEAYTQKTRQLLIELDGFKLQKNNFRDQIDTHRRSIAAGEHKLDVSQSKPRELRMLGEDMEDKKGRIKKITTDIKAANYEERLTEKTANARAVENRRDALNTELRSLSLQADARARLDIKRVEFKRKTTDVQNTLELASAKYRKYVGSDVNAESMEKELERISVDKEREHSEMDNTLTTANGELQRLDTTLSHLKAQVKAKREELKRLEKDLKTGIELHPTLDLAIQEATTELNIRQTEIGSMTGVGQIYDDFLTIGKQKKVCTACNRPMDDHELIVFEKYMKDQKKKYSPEAMAASAEERLDWEAEFARLQGLLPVQASRDQLKSVELPALEQQIQALEAESPAVSRQAEEALDKLNDLKRQLKDIVVLKEHASNVSRTQKELERLKQEIASIENDLLATGSTKTADDVQAELDALTENLRTIEKEKQALMSEREQQRNVLYTLETGLHQLQLQENTLNNEIRERGVLEEQLEAAKKEITTLLVKSKELDLKIAEAQAPIDLLGQEYQQAQDELKIKTDSAQRLSQELNQSVDRLNSANKDVERYVRERRGPLLQQCEKNIEEIQEQINDFVVAVENMRVTISKIEKEINEGGASVARIRDNIRVRKLIQEIARIQAEMESYDLEEAAKSKRNFQEKYNVEKQRETDLQGKKAHLQGELSSHKSQLKESEDDLKEFKNINKRYTDQLIRVKMSDMANSDLEKYAKALENAIMKYHSLKMEEVNDTMRHLWNKTYQGTDIDGISIRSDVEGGATKRSYNYRVVMTKDQVEMDMRGRCSAGQKMLASIIIRLALSDSFGQNCGILALDEPTNALDTENIDALASSLVDIINERKGHSNFQLIIITHDENFLRKLGQSDVMEFYWRVSRDPRQKSIIERQRFK